jgi:adenosylhomocysteine nucleosidase
VRWSGSGPTGMPKVAIVAALDREVSGLTRNWSRVEQHCDGRSFVFFERDDMVVVCGGIGVEAARRAAEAAIALYRPALLQSVGFAGALDSSLRVGDIFMPAVVIDARDGSRVEIDGATAPRAGTSRPERSSLVTFMAVAGAQQKASLAKSYRAQAVDMEAAGVAAAARAHDIGFGVTKVISDELNFEVPHMARFIDARGQFRTASFAAFVALRPVLWGRVAQLASNSRKAARALGEHLERYRQELRRASDRTSGEGSGQDAEKIVAPPSPEPQAAAASGLSSRSRE